MVVLGIIPSMVSLSVWSDVGCAVSNWINLLLSLGKGFWKNQWVLSRVKIIGSNGGDVSLPTFRVGITFLSISPSIVSLFIGFNLRLGIVIWNVSLSLLGENNSWGKSTTIVGNPI